METYTYTHIIYVYIRIHFPRLHSYTCVFVLWKARGDRKWRRRVRKRFRQCYCCTRGKSLFPRFETYFPTRGEVGRKRGGGFEGVGGGLVSMLFGSIWGGRTTWKAWQIIRLRRLNGTRARISRREQSQFRVQFGPGCSRLCRIISNERYRRIDG